MKLDSTKVVIPADNGLDLVCATSNMPQSQPSYPTAPPEGNLRGSSLLSMKPMTHYHLPIITEAATAVLSEQIAPSSTNSATTETEEDILMSALGAGG